LPILPCHSRESGNPVLRSIAGITGSVAFARDDTLRLVDSITVVFYRIAYLLVFVISLALP
jgi:hypothetical protein